MPCRGTKIEEILSRVRILDRCIQRRKHSTETDCRETAPLAAVMNGCGEKRRPRAGVAQAIRRLGLVDRHGVALNHRIIDPIASADAAISRTARDLR